MNEPYAMTKKTRTVLLAVAASLLFLVVLWIIFRSGGSSLKKVADEINKFGYNFTADDMLIAYDNSNASIAEVLDDVDLSEAVEASIKAGFPSDVNKIGGVTLILANDGNDIVTVYLVDGKIELCFVQTMGGNVAAINKR